MAKSETVKRLKRRNLLKANKKKLEYFEKVVKKVKIGRNELCPCNSGLKYKKCCMNKFNK